MDAPLRVIALHGGSVSGFQPVKHRLEKGRSPIMYKIDTLNIRCQLDTEVSIQNHIAEVVSCLYILRACPSVHNLPTTFSILSCPTLV